MKILNQIQNHYKVHTDNKIANSNLKKSRTFTTSVRYIIFFKQKVSIQLLSLRNPRTFVLQEIGQDGVAAYSSFPQSTILIDCTLSSWPPVQQVTRGCPPHDPDSSVRHKANDSNQISCFGASAGFLEGMHRNICFPDAQLARCTQIGELVFSGASGIRAATYNLVQHAGEESLPSQMLPSLNTRFQTDCHF